MRTAKPKKNRRGSLGKARGMLKISKKQSARKASKAGYKPTKTRTANAGTKSMASATAAGRKTNAKAVRNDKLVVKNRKLNKSAKAAATATTAGKAPIKSKLTKVGKAKLTVKQTGLNIKGKVKAFGRRRLSAKHRKAISDALKRRS